MESLNRIKTFINGSCLKEIINKLIDLNIFNKRDI
jgi:hypothetical protein